MNNGCASLLQDLKESISGLPDAEQIEQIRKVIWEGVQKAPPSERVTYLEDLAEEFPLMTPAAPVQVVSPPAEPTVEELIEKLVLRANAGQITEQQKAEISRKLQSVGIHTEKEVPVPLVVPDVFYQAFDLSRDVALDARRVFALVAQLTAKLGLLFARARQTWHWLSEDGGGTEILPSEKALGKRLGQLLVNLSLADQQFHDKVGAELRTERLIDALMVAATDGARRFAEDHYQEFIAREISEKLCAALGTQPSPKDLWRHFERQTQSYDQQTFNDFFRRAVVESVKVNRSYVEFVRRR